MGTGVVGGREGAYHELTRLDGCDRAADFLDDTAILVSHRRRAVDGLQAPVRPEVRSTNAGCRKTKDRIRWRDDFRVLAVFEPDVTGSVQNCTFHGCILPFI